jgi:hypothetical protein
MLGRASKFTLLYDKSIIIFNKLYILNKLGLSIGPMVANTVSCYVTYFTELALNGKSIDRSKFIDKKILKIFYIFLIIDGFIGMTFVALGLFLCLS